MTASTHTDDPLDAARARMKAAGMRITRPRLAVLGALIHRSQPSSVEQIHAGLGGGRCDLVTVYRCMAAFEEIGLVRKAVFLNGAFLYGVNRGGPPSYYVNCRESGRMEPIDADTAAELARALKNAEDRLRARGYTAVGHTVSFFGARTS